jgi:hypothetical protein
MQAIRQPSPTGLAPIGLSEERLPEKPNSKFVLAHPPGQYEFVAGQWLPVLKHLVLRPGVNGVVEPEKGGHANYFGRLVRDGWTIIDPLPAGGVLVADDDGQIEAADGYLIPWPCQRGRMKGTYYSDVWSTPTVLGRGERASVSWHFDRAGWNAWRAQLVGSGKIPAPRPADVGIKIATQRKRSERQIAGAHDGAPHIQAKVEAHQARLTEMEASAAALAPPKPKRRKRSAKRPTPTGV